MPDDQMLTIDASRFVRVDARGLRCPWPVLRLARALREGATAVELLSDDPAAAGEVAAFARERGLAVEQGTGRYIIRTPITG